MAQTGLTGKRIAVTGATGFLGGHLCRSLLAQNAQVTALCRDAPLMMAGVTSLMCGDLATGDIAAVLQEALPDVIIHCAGQSMADTAGLEAANVTATRRLIAAALTLPTPPRLVAVSSAAIWAPMRDDQTAVGEDHPMVPVTPYGQAKARMTELVLSAATSLPVAVACPFNIVGPGQPGQMLPQAFIQRLRADPGRISLTSGGVVRDFIDVRDVATALVALADPAIPSGQIFNVATGRGVRVGDLLGAVCRMGGFSPIIDVPAQPSHTGVACSIGDATRLHKTCGWRPIITLDETLADMLHS